MPRDCVEKKCELTRSCPFNMRKEAKVLFVENIHQKNPKISKIKDKKKMPLPYALWRSTMAAPKT